MINREILKERIEENLLNYVGTRTETNSQHENNVKDFFQDWFKKVPYFQDNPDYCGLYPIVDDYLDRAVPWCLLKGKGEDTLVFIHHCDTVETKDYGVLEELSLKPYQLMEAFKEGRVKLPKEVLEDLHSDEWIFGRGACDMKGGGSIQLALMEEYSKRKDFNGNIVLLALPDEENLSAGMIAAVSLLKELKEKYNLDYKLMLDSEPHERGEDLRPVIYDGSIGKIMPVAYVRGKLTHVGQIFSGFNPIHLMAELIRRTELNPSFIERVGNTTNPPPTWLYHKDRKEVYDVSLPLASTAYMSFLPLSRTPKSIMDELKEISHEAFEAVIEHINESYKAYCQIGDMEFEEIGWQPKVVFYSELYEEALRDSGEEFVQAYEDLMADIRSKFHGNQISIIDAATTIIEKTLDYVKDKSPCLVLALTPPYYPSTNNSMLGERADQVNEILDSIKAYGRENHGLDYEVQNYFTAIADLSYSMFVSDKEDIDYIEENMLMWKDIYYIPLETIKEISMPVLNIGPFGRDLHKYTERVYKEDLFYRTPDLIDLLVRNLLNN